jgi:hypothetical protein
MQASHSNGTDRGYTWWFCIPIDTMLVAITSAK